MIRKAGRGPVARAAARRSVEERRARERRQRTHDVLAAARALFVKKGYDGATMADIAAASGFAIGTLYELFPSKDTILLGLLEDRVDQLLGRLRDVAAREGADPARQIADIVRTHLGFFREDPALLRLTLTAWTGSDFTVRRDLGERIDRKHREYLALVLPVFERGVRGRVFARRPPMRMAVALTGLINALIRRWVREPGLDLAAEGEGLLEIFFDGIRAAGRRRTMS